jgi:hypothetical protein
MAPDRDGISISLGSSQNMDRERKELDENESTRPSDLGSADYEQHRDPETDDSRVE